MLCFNSSNATKLRLSNTRLLDGSAITFEIAAEKPRPGAMVVNRMPRRASGFWL
jgi:hypothetical protein